MSSSLNSVHLIGNLGQEPELRYTNSGDAVCTLSIATNRSWKDKDGKLQTRTQWHRVVVWGKQAESCKQYLSKGRQVFVEGELQTRKYLAGDNSPRFITEVRATQVKFLGGGQKAVEEPAEETTESVPVTDDDAVF